MLWSYSYIFFSTNIVYFFVEESTNIVYVMLMLIYQIQRQMMTYIKHYIEETYTSKYVSKLIINCTIIL